MHEAQKPQAQLCEPVLTITMNIYSSLAKLGDEALLRVVVQAGSQHCAPAASQAAFHS